MYVTGRIADMDIFLGWKEDYPVAGISSFTAKSIFSLIGGLKNRYLVIIFLGLILNLLVYLTIRNYIDKKNFYIWKIILLTPGLLIYSNSPTKETLFILPSIIYIILECNYIASKKSINFLNFFLKCLLLVPMFLIRGDFTYMYFLLSVFSLILKNKKIGKIHTKLRLDLLFLKAFLISILLNFSITYFFPDYIERLASYLGSSLKMDFNIYRPNEFFTIIENPSRIITSQYLALFPTIGELLEKPYQLIILIDSIMLIYCFIKSWKELFEIVDSYKILKRVISFFFIYVTLVYFLIYGLIGSFNLGATQRFRINYIPLGIIFPIILNRNLRNRQAILFLKNK